jgi:CTP synthase
MLDALTLSRWPGSHGAVYFHHRRRGLLAWQGSASAASLGALLQARGYKVRIRKFDPYLNVDPGTMSPYQHGEVYRHRRRRRDRPRPRPLRALHRRPAHQSDNITTGRIYQRHHRQGAARRLSRRDRPGHPHVTNAIKEFALADTDGLDFVICEIGGTVGDIESLPFVEAIRQLRNDDSAAARHASRPHHAGALHRRRRRAEDQADPARSRADQLDRHPARRPAVPLRPADPEGERAKIACSATSAKSAVIPALDARSIYDVPLQYHEEGLDDEVLRAFGIDRRARSRLARWRDIMDRIDHPEGEVTIGVVGKYVGLPDAYKSLREALVHGGIANRSRSTSAGSTPSCSSIPKRPDRRRARAAPRHPRPRRLRRARQRGQDRRGQVRPRARGALLRHLPRHADGVHRGARNTRRHRGGLDHRVRRDRPSRWSA